MYDIISIAAGMVLRSKGEDYGALAKLAVIWGFIAGIIAGIVTLIAASVGMVVTLPSYLTGFITITGPMLALVWALVVMVVSFLYMMVGALVYDLAEYLIRSF